MCGLRERKTTIGNSAQRFRKDQAGPYRVLLQFECLSSGIENGCNSVIYAFGPSGVRPVSLLRFLLGVPYLRLIVGALALMGLVVVVTTIFPAAARDTILILGAMGLSALIVFVIY